MGQCTQVCTIPIYLNLVDGSVGVELRVNSVKEWSSRGERISHISLIVPSLTPWLGNTIFFIIPKVLGVTSYRLSI